VQPVHTGFVWVRLLSTPAEGAAVSGGGSAVPDVDDACSSYIARSAHRSLRVVSATISDTCVQKHDARLDRLVNAPDWLIWHCIRHGEGPWPLLACRAAYVKLGVTGKY
jgi:hypothetical protein